VYTCDWHTYTWFIFVLTVGAQYWQLPCVELEYEVCMNQLKWFAQFLLEGAVFSRLQPFVKHLLSPASLMTKQWAQSVLISAEFIFKQQCTASVHIFCYAEKDFYIYCVTFYASALHCNSWFVIETPNYLINSAHIFNKFDAFEAM